MLRYCGEMPARRSSPSEFVADTMPSASSSDQSMSKNWLPAISPSSETVVSVLMSLWITLTYFLSSSSDLGLPMKRSASSARENSSPRWADRKSIRRSLRSTSLPVWNEVPDFFWWFFLGSASSGSRVVLVMVGVATVALPVSSDDLSASIMFDAAWRRRLKASTASCGLTITAPGCSSTNMARSSESV